MEEPSRLIPQVYSDLMELFNNGILTKAPEIRQRIYQDLMAGDMNAIYSLALSAEASLKKTYSQSGDQRLKIRRDLMHSFANQLQFNLQKEGIKLDPTYWQKYSLDPSTKEVKPPGLDQREGYSSRPEQRVLRKDNLVPIVPVPPVTRELHPTRPPSQKSTPTGS